MQTFKRTVSPGRLSSPPYRLSSNPASNLLISFKILFSWVYLYLHALLCISEDCALTQLLQKYTELDTSETVSSPLQGTTGWDCSLLLPERYICERNNTNEAVKNLALISSHTFRITLNTLQLLLAKKSCSVTLTFNGLPRLQVTLQTYRSGVPGLNENLLCCSCGHFNWKNRAQNSTSHTVEQLLHWACSC